MRQVSGNTGGVDDIVEDKLVNERGELEEQRQGLCGNNPDVSSVRLRDTGMVLQDVSVPNCGRHTCPMPPAAPATTNTYVVSKLATPRCFAQSLWLSCSPALTILTISLEADR